MVAEATPTTRVLTIPNFVSFLRLLGVPLFWWVLVVEDNIALAGWLIIIIASTDWIDGYLARRLNQVSELGKVLDPVADRLVIVSAVIGGLITKVLPAVIGWGLLAREIVMAVIALNLVVRKAGQLEVRWLGKATTSALYGALPAFYLAKGEFLPAVFFAIAWFFGVIGLVLYWYVAIQYIGDARERLAAVESPTEPEEV